MPVRFWVLTGIIIGLGAVAFIVLVIAVPSSSLIEEPAPVVVADEAAPATPEPDVLDLVLIADLVALANERQADLPATHMPVPGGPTTLTLVTAAAGQITFAYEVEIDPPDYVLVTAPTELFPGLEANFCVGVEGRACFGFSPAFNANVCADPELRPLIDRGAVVRYLFRDINRRPLAETSVTASSCAA